MRRDIVSGKALLCDIARQEAVGKFYCLGIYPNNALAVYDFTRPFIVSMYVEILTSVTGSFDVSFRAIDIKSDADLLHLDSQLLLQGRSTPPIATGPLSFLVPSPTEIVFSFDLDGENYEMLRASITQAIGGSA